MGKWGDLAARYREGEGGGDNSAKRAKRPAAAPIDPIEPIAALPLPPAILDGLERLRRQPAPRLSLPDAWPEIVSDALRLDHEGWGAKALALGWHPLQLWGAHLDTPGLAVWLCGRRIALLEAGGCTVLNGPGRYECFTARPPAEGTCFLWEYGRRGR